MQNLYNTISKLLVSILLIFIVANASGQAINRHEANSLLKLLGKSKTDTGSINILLRLARFQVFKPGEYKQDLDSAKVYIEKAKAINNKLNSGESLGFITIVEAFLTKETGQKDISKKMIERAVRILINEKNKSLLAEAYLELSEYYDYNDSSQLTEKINLVEEAVSGFQQSQNKERLGYSLKVLGDLYDIQGQLSKALEKLDLSLKAYNSIHYTQLQDVYILYGGVYFDMSNYKQALYYELLALSNAESSKDTSMNLCQIHNLIGITLLRLDEREAAISHFKTALQIAEKYNDNSNVLVVIRNIVDSYNKMAKPEEGLKVLNNIPHKFLNSVNDKSHYVVPYAYLSIYYNLKKYKQAQPYANQLSGIIKAHKPGDTKLINVYNLLTSYYISSGQLKLADFYLKKTDSLSKKMGDPDRINYKNYLKFSLDTALGYFKLAVYDLLVYNKINDSLFNETKSKQIKQLEIEYETGKKEDSLKLKDKDILVLSQLNQSQQTNLQKANLLKNVTIGGIFLLSLIIVLLYRQFRLKKLNSRTISYKNEILGSLLIEKEWLLKEVHHRVKNNLQIMISLLNTQSKYLESNDAIKAIRESQERMEAISLIHQKLYKSDDMAFINIGDYVRELVEHIRNGFSGSSGIVLDLSITESQVDVAQAVPLGLILNEAISNIFKYAFPGKSSGMVTISITRSADKESLLLTITDNGIGLPANYDFTKKASFGIRLMQGLSKQMGGSFKIENNNGVTIQVAFAESKVIKFMRTETSKIVSQAV